MSIPDSKESALTEECRAERAAFEAWVKSPPYEHDTSRFPRDETKFAWPGQYRDITVELAWEAWQARAAINAELLEALQGLMELERRGRFMPIGSEWDKARAAIAKAQA